MFLSFIWQGAKDVCASCRALLSVWTCYDTILAKTNATPGLIALINVPQWLNDRTK